MANSKTAKKRAKKEAAKAKGIAPPPGPRPSLTRPGETVRNPIPIGPPRQTPKPTFGEPRRKENP